MILSFGGSYGNYTDMSRIDYIAFIDGDIEIVWKVKKDYEKAPITGVFEGTVIGKWLSTTEAGLEAVGALEIEFRNAIIADDRLFDFQERLFEIMERPGNEHLKDAYRDYVKNRRKREC